MHRILVIDPDPKVSQMLGVCLADLPLEVFSAPTLEEGVHGAGGVADLILIDDLVGGVSRELALEIRERNYATLTPVIAMTRAQVNKEQWRAMGYSDFLPKPPSAVRVREALLRWLPALRSPAHPPAATGRPTVAGHQPAA